MTLELSAAQSREKAFPEALMNRVPASSAKKWAVL